MTDPKLSDADWKVMEALWHRGRATARDIHDDVSPNTGWAYTTVKTMLDRLAEKGAVDKDDASARAGVYRPLVARQQARRHAARGLIERAFGGSVAPLVHFLLESEPLSDADRAELLAKLEQDGKRDRQAEKKR